MIPVGVKHVIDIRTQKAEQATNTRVSKRNQYLHQSASIVEAWLNEFPLHLAIELGLRVVYLHLSGPQNYGNTKSI